jgi:hypothetical protein
MQGYLPGYALDPTTWAYLSSFLTIGIFFKFHRLWSVRNLDLMALIALAPGLLWVADRPGAGGYVWLFAVGGFFLVRLLLDPLMARRPLLEPNLNASGLTFTGIAMLLFLMTNVATGRVSSLASQPMVDNPEVRGAYPLLYDAADLSVADPSRDVNPPDDAGDSLLSRRRWARATILRTMAILAHLAVVLGLALIGYRHFGNIHTGVAMGSLYLLVPYTAQMTPRIDHVVPGALLVWAVAAYRRPALAGILIGLAAGLIGYPLYLLPLWCSFYWRRGLVRFLLGVVSGLVLTVVMLAVVAAVFGLFGVGEFGPFGDRLRQMFGWAKPFWATADGFWQYHPQAFRYPVMAAFWVLCGSLALWPAQKNLGTLLSCSAAAMLGVQFWQTHHGGLYIAWYLPLLVMTIFRPNLEDRVAVAAVTEGWLAWRSGARSPWRIEDWLPWRKKVRVARQKKR